MSKKSNKNRRGAVGRGRSSKQVQKFKNPKFKGFVRINYFIHFVFTSFGNFKAQLQFNKNSKEIQTLIYRVGDERGFCNRNKKTIIRLIYNGACPFSEGLAAA